MPFEGIPLREITEAELRQLVTSGMAEHLLLEYKQDIYQNNHEGEKELFSTFACLQMLKAGSC